jgi:SAM-dependent methyltransferase
MSQLDRLSMWWRLSGPEPDGSLAKRVIHRTRRLLARVLGPQETFNAAVVDHIKRSVAADQAAIAWAHATHEELRVAINVLQHATRTLRHDVERLGAPASAQGAPGRPTPVAALPSGDHTYVGFEDRFRGTQADIRQRMARYLPVFAGASDVLDVGCGRGEFLGLLREQGIRARGIDVNRAMVDACRDAGLDATHADALSYLQGLPDGSLGGLIAAQVVEHLEPRYLMALIETAFAKLRAGAPIVLETINPTCWSAFFDSYIRDLTHVRPVHPDTLKFLVMAAGFADVHVQGRSPYPEQGKLSRVRAATRSAAADMPALLDVADVVDRHADRLNELFFTDRDYAVIARRP